MIVAAPIEAVFDMFVDATLLATWFPRARGLTDLSGKLDEAGTTYTLLFAGPARASCEVTEVERPVQHERTFVLSFGIFDHVLRSVRGCVKMHFRAEGPGTNVTLDCEYVPPAGLGGRLVGVMIERQVADEMKRFKDTVERAAPNDDVLSNDGEPARA
jgi:uncharacterized protein YndB with AHSA1/START domain